MSREEVLKSGNPARFHDDPENEPVVDDRWEGFIRDARL
jgi:hypothetical protein